MVTVYDVDPNKLIDKLAEKLEKDIKIEKPEWVRHVKSGAHVEHRPEQDNFWYIRMASILRKAYVNGKIGVNRLREMYGGKKNRGRKPPHHYDASGAIIRRAMQSLEKHGLLKKEKVGRILTPKARSLLDNTAFEVSKASKV
ncbi:30S ribosomal protein S19e [Candidatus Micrarchaeota archaeon]|nr:30S ribosomal protein S19e [Candidatus Micrarchaeota archaeon]